MSEIKTKLILDNKQFMDGIREANGAGKDFDNTIRSQGSAMTSAVGAAKALAGSYLAIKAAKFALDQVSKGVQISGQIETEKARLEVLLGSMEEAERLMNRVMAKASETPLSTQELQGATRMLIAFGSNSETVVDELTRLGDLSQGVGMGIGELAELYGKARTQGTLFAEDINQLTGRGIPIVQEFAKMLGVSEAEVKKLASEGKIGFKELEQAIMNMTGEGGRFNGMMEKMSATWEGKLSTLKDNFDQLIRIPVGEWVISWAKPMVEALNQAADKTKIIQEARKDALESVGGFEKQFMEIKTTKDRDTFADQTIAAAVDASMRLIKVQAMGDKDAEHELKKRIAMLDHMTREAWKLDEATLRANEEKLRQEEAITREKKAQADADARMRKNLDMYVKHSRTVQEKDWRKSVPEMDTGSVLEQRAIVSEKLKAANADAFSLTQGGDTDALKQRLDDVELLTEKLALLNAEINKRIGGQKDAEAAVDSAAQARARKKLIEGAVSDGDKGPILKEMELARLEVEAMEKLFRSTNDLELFQSLPARINEGYNELEKLEGALARIDKQDEDHRKEQQREQDKIGAEMRADELGKLREREKELVEDMRLNVPEMGGRNARAGLSLGGPNVESLARRQLDEMGKMRRELEEIRKKIEPERDAGTWR